MFQAKQSKLWPDALIVTQLRGPTTAILSIQEALGSLTQISEAGEHIGPHVYSGCQACKTGDLTTAIAPIASTIRGDAECLGMCLACYNGDEIKKCRKCEQQTSK